MSFQDLPEADKAAISALNEYLNEKVATLFPAADPGLVYAPHFKYEDDTSAEFRLKDGQNWYIYFEDKRTKAMYCYTPWADTRGWYWCFDYAPRGKGSRSGDPSRWMIKNPVKFRKRKAARARAKARYRKATGKDW